MTQLVSNCMFSHLFIHNLHKDLPLNNFFMRLIEFSPKSSQSSVIVTLLDDSRLLSVPFQTSFRQVNLSKWQTMWKDVFFKPLPTIMVIQSLKIGIHSTFKWRWCTLTCVHCVSCLSCIDDIVMIWSENSENLKK